MAATNGQNVGIKFVDLSTGSSDALEPTQQTRSQTCMNATGHNQQMLTRGDPVTCTQLHKHVLTFDIQHGSNLSQHLY
jgi:hypothetical protein